MRLIRRFMPVFFLSLQLNSLFPERVASFAATIRKLFLIVHRYVACRQSHAILSPSKHAICSPIARVDGHFQQDAIRALIKVFPSRCEERLQLSCFSSDDQLTLVFHFEAEHSSTSGNSNELKAIPPASSIHPIVYPPHSAASRKI